MAEFIPTGIGGFASSRPTKRKVTTQDKPNTTTSFERHELLPPPRPVRNFIPAQEVIDSLVTRAIAALSKGIYWDRGSIINIVL
ncbi:MAG TPA: hypothetical protein VFT64_00590 [Rickettsiales bacterium]|nr:hypothetical protein [Rickettsiales bacterium]